jgi:hypothetical protein
MKTINTQDVNASNRKHLSKFVFNFYSTEYCTGRIFHKFLSKSSPWRTRSLKLNANFSFIHAQLTSSHRFTCFVMTCLSIISLNHSCHALPNAKLKSFHLRAHCHSMRDASRRGRVPVARALNIQPAIAITNLMPVHHSSLLPP